MSTRNSSRERIGILPSMDSGRGFGSLAPSYDLDEPVSDEAVFLGTQVWAIAAG
jgi:hypothetical protein